MSVQDLGSPTGRTSKIVNLSSIPTTSTTVLSITGKPGRISSIYINANGTSVTLNVVIDGTTYTYTGTTSGFVSMNTTNAISITANLISGGQPFLLDMQWNNSVSITASNATAGGYVNVQYES